MCCSPIEQGPKFFCNTAKIKSELPAIHVRVMCELKRHEPAPVALHAVADDSAGEISANSVQVPKMSKKMSKKWIACIQHHSCKIAHTLIFGRPMEAAGPASVWR
jgi:hypothetical protein